MLSLQPERSVLSLTQRDIPRPFMHRRSTDLSSWAGKGHDSACFHDWEDGTYESWIHETRAAKRGGMIMDDQAIAKGESVWSIISFACPVCAVALGTHSVRLSTSHLM